MKKRLRVYKMAQEKRVSQRNGHLLRNAIQTDGAIVTYNWHIPGHPPVAPHSHPFDQLAMCMAGTMIMTVDGEEYLMETGDALVIPADLPHGSRIVGDEVVLNVDVFAPSRADYEQFAVNTGKDE
jgi:quercetin dioxygenase-like cupin family protein